MDVLKERNKKWMNAIIIIAFMTIFGLLPPFGPVTPMGMKVLGIFIGCIYGWTVGETIWPSILALVMLGFTEGNTVAGMFTAAYGNATLHMVLFCMILCYGIEKCGLLESVTKYILSRKFVQKGPWWLCFAFWMASSVASAITVATLAVTILCWSIFYDIAKRLNLDKRSPYVAVVMIGIAMCSYLGGCVMPYNAFSQICFGVLKAAAPDITISFGAYCLTMIILNIVAIPVIILFCKYFLRIKVNYESVGDLVKTEELVITRNQKIVALYLGILCAILILPSYLPAGMALKTILSNLGFTGTFAAIAIVMTLTIDKNGENLLDIGKGIMYGMPWGLYFLLGTALAISGMLTSEATGISALLIGILNPIMEGKSAMVFMMLMVVCGIVLTNCINNIVCITLMVPISLAFLATNGGNPAVMAALFCMVLYQGIVMPAGSVFGALLHGNTEWLSSALIYKYATLMEIVLAIILALVGVPVGNFIFSIL